MAFKVKCVINEILAMKRANKKTKIMENRDKGKWLNIFFFHFFIDKTVIWLNFKVQNHLL